MASLKDLRRRITSVKSTRQITKAMQLVAASKLRRAQEAIQSARPFAEKLDEMTKRILAEVLEGAGDVDAAKKEKLLSSLHPLLQGNGSAGADTEFEFEFVAESSEEDQESFDEYHDDAAEAETASRPPLVAVEKEPGVNKIALLIVTSDRGLCGAYNTNVNKAAFERINTLRADPKNKVDVYYVGRRAFDYMRLRGISGHRFEDFWAGKFTTLKSDPVADFFTKLFVDGVYQSVEVVYTEFITVLTQKVKSKVMLPLRVDASAAVEGAEQNSTSYIYEPGRKELLAQLLPTQVRTQFYRSFAEALASEYGSRMTSMDNATRNAGEMISKLTLQANRLRQANITKEICEIVGGAEALNG